MRTPRGFRSGEAGSQVPATPSSDWRELRFQNERVSPSWPIRGKKSLLITPKVESG